MPIKLDKQGGYEGHVCMGCRLLRYSGAYKRPGGWGALETDGGIDFLCPNCLKRISTLKRSGRRMTTGRFDTREELVEKVKFLHEHTSCSLSDIARNTEISVGTVSRILSNIHNPDTQTPSQPAKPSGRYS